MVDLAVASPDAIEGEVEAGLPITSELNGGVRGDITGGADEVEGLEALNYEVKRK